MQLYQFDRRVEEDRRFHPTVALSKYTLLGKRRKSRRKTDLHQIYVDRYSLGLVILLCTILFLCILDGYLTIYNVFFMNVSELNPVMAYFLDKNITLFLLIKHGLTSMGLIFLCVRINFSYIRSTLVTILFLYIIVICSHLYIVFFSLLFPLSV